MPIPFFMYHIATPNIGFAYFIVIIFVVDVEFHLNPNFISSANKSEPSVFLSDLLWVEVVQTEQYSHYKANDH